MENHKVSRASNRDFELDDDGDWDLSSLDLATATFKEIMEFV
jgi:hypothetical protein